MTEVYRIESIALKEVGVFDDIRIDFKPIESLVADEKKAEVHLFTGGNGCGKSTLLYALAGMFADPPDASSLHFRRLRGLEGQVDFTFCNISGMYRYKKPGETLNEFQNYKAFSDENVLYIRFIPSYIKNDWLGNYLFLSSSEYRIHNNGISLKAPFAAFAYSGQRTLADTTVRAIQEIPNSPFENALSFNHTVRPQLLTQWIANNRTKAALALADGDKAAIERYNLSLRRITQLVKDVCDLDVAFKLERDPLSVALSINGDFIDFDLLPDGLKSIISWVADLSMRLEAIPWARPELDIFAQPIILFLDEIDIHLHPHWQRRILPAVQRLLPNAQIFASTHSPFVVGSVEDAWIYSLPEKGKAASRLIEGVPSNPGKSYRAVLEEIFGVEKEFGEEIEKLFDQFYERRKLYLVDKLDLAELTDLAGLIAAKGEEPQAIIARELRQISRLKGVEVSLP